jgi:hypothetical protein
MECGCSKRFDIETLEFRPQNYTGSDPYQAQNPRPSTTIQTRLPTYNPAAAQFSMQPGPTRTQLSVANNINNMYIGNMDP